MSSGLAELFVAALAGTDVPPAPLVEPDRAELDEALATEIAAARAAWPSVDEPTERFVRYLAERAPRAASPVASLRAMRTADLYLASACARADPAALKAYDDGFSRDVRGALASLRLGAAEIDDLAQTLVARFFVGLDGSRPKILDYGGRGKLRSWVRTAATRAGLDYIEARRPEVPLEDDLFDHVPSTGDPELDHLKRCYRAEFRRAFEQALASLLPREQTLLAQSFVDELSIDQIGRLHGVHRATAARWVVKAREALLAGTRANLRALLDVDRFQIDSIMRLIASQLEASLGTLLKSRR
jgi:RNA polymerase sigma-70 factor (ECF subfamily)